MLTYIMRECPRAPPSACTPTSPCMSSTTSTQVSLSPSAVPLETPTLLSPWTCELTLSLHLLTELSPLQAQWRLSPFYEPDPQETEARIVRVTSLPQLYPNTSQSATSS